MKSSFAVVVISLLVVSLLFTGVQGIRFKKGHFPFVGHHDEERSSLIKTSDDGSSSTTTTVGEVVWKDCNTGSMNRKLISTTTTTSSHTSAATTSKNEANTTTSTFGEKLQAGDFTTNSPPTFDDEQNQSSHDHYVDLTDIAEMDYSPARRKPPIHN